jgi:DNA processing protein
VTGSRNPDEARPAGGEELIPWLRLTLVPGIGAARQRQLLAAFGPPDKIFSSSRHAIAQIIGDELAGRLLAADTQAQIQATQEWLQEAGNTILTLGDPDYPVCLLEISDPPVLLYVKGNPAWLNRPSLAMVGARSATPQGAATARAFAQSLAGVGLTIVSGLALGIDAAAHEGAVAEAGGTVAVIGTGIDRIYPASNKALAHRIAEAGAIVSEFPLGTPALAANFPRRNRIIAGLARGVLVVEAALGSGSLITARLAAEQGREVFAIPGSIHSPLSKGCHRLIRDGAKLVETAADVLEELRWNGLAAQPSSPPPQPIPEPAPEESQVLAALGHDPADLDALAQRCGLTADALYAILLPMELDGRIARLPGGRFQQL